MYGDASDMPPIDPATPSNPAADPFTVFHETRRRAAGTDPEGRRFNSGEHVWLGTRGVGLAREQLAQSHGVAIDERLLRQIPRQSSDEVLEYGEIVALSGDFYETPEALFEERPAPLPWLWEDNDLSDLRELFEAELDWISERHRNRDERPVYPDYNIRMMWNSKSMIELALRNEGHFGWHNIELYLRYHAEALQLAYDSHGREGETFRRAVYVNAFADHFLTDGFSAGHIRVPRAEIVAWAERERLSPKIAGLLSKLLHDQDGHVDLHSLHGVAEGRREDGLPVRNSLGTTWRTRCDGQLFLDPDDLDGPAVTTPVAAVAASVRELLLAWRQGELPKGIYEATRYVPFPDPTAPRLVDKFPADISDIELDELWKGTALYAKVIGLRVDHFRRLFVALPGLMAQFRTSIAAAVDRDPQISERVAPEYIAAFRSIDLRSP